MPTMTTTAETFTVEPTAYAPVDGDAGALLDAVLSALEQDKSAIAPACSYDYETGEISATFQIEVTRHAFPTTALGATLDDATTFAFQILHQALEHAGVTVDLPRSHVRVARGDNPDLLF